MGPVESKQGGGKIGIAGGERAVLGKAQSSSSGRLLDIVDPQAVGVAGDLARDELDGVRKVNPRPDDLKVQFDKHGFRGGDVGGEGDNTELPDSSSPPRFKKDENSQPGHKPNDEPKDALGDEDDSDEDVLSNILAHYFQDSKGATQAASECWHELETVLADARPISCFVVEEDIELDPKDVTCQIGIVEWDLGAVLKEATMDDGNTRNGVDRVIQELDSLGCEEQTRLKGKAKATEDLGMLKQDRVAKGKKKRAPPIALRQSSRIKQDDSGVNLRSSKFEIDQHIDLLKAKELAHAMIGLVAIGPKGNKMKRSKRRVLEGERGADRENSYFGRES
ncbi:hypothetical protein GUJ93_ZPchr0011g27328 [Zizania palustris]|uniref:Uncharacterized protein n=1 Tax=Zizania palustris TaxID=103762 RepID=A0A8J5WG19_ZIZPA|nr:hypothetical protein GUJ93_ZPchr0011g27328 [Zizania palustris]